MVVGKVRPEAMLEGAGSAYWRWNVVTFAYWMTARSIQKCPYAICLPSEEGTLKTALVLA